MYSSMNEITNPFVGFKTYMPTLKSFVTQNQIRVGDMAKLD
jgi:hypothetical protein